MDKDKILSCFVNGREKFDTIVENLPTDGDITLKDLNTKEGILEQLSQAVTNQTNIIVFYQVMTTEGNVSYCREAFTLIKEK